MAWAFIRILWQVIPNTSESVDEVLVRAFLLSLTQLLFGLLITIKINVNKRPIMKHNILKTALSVIIILGMSSCTHTLYSPNAMASNYELRMQSKKELAAKSQVQIFLSESEVDGDFTVISLNTYNPLSIPVIMSFQKQTTKKFYQKAVLKAQEQGGNGIIITSAGIYKVIKLTNVDANN